MRLPVVTHANLSYCEGLLLGLEARREEFLANVRLYPLEISIENEYIEFRDVLVSENDVELLLFGLELLVKTVQETPEPPKDGVASTVYSRLRRRLFGVST